MKSCTHSLNLIKGSFLCPRVVTWRTRCSGMVLLPGGRAARARAVLFPWGRALRAPAAPAASPGREQGLSE